MYLYVAARTRGAGGVDGKLAGVGDAARVVAELRGATVTLFAGIHHPVAAAGDWEHTLRHVPQALVFYGVKLLFDHLPTAGAPCGVGQVLVAGDGEQLEHVTGSVWTTGSKLLPQVFAFVSKSSPHQS